MTNNDEFFCTNCRLHKSIEFISNNSKKGRGICKSCSEKKKPQKREFKTLTAYQQERTQKYLSKL